MTKKEKANIDKIIAQAEKIIPVKTIEEGISKVKNAFRKRLIGGKLVVNGYYTFTDEENVKTFIFLEA